LLEVYDIHGQRIRTFINEKQAAGEYVVQFDGSDLPTGMYLVRLMVGNKTETRKLVLINDY
jgi:hypothetical protein